MASLEELERVEGALQGLLEAVPPSTTDEETFWGAQFDAGLAWVDFPVGYGGLGLSANLQSLVDQRVLDAGGSLRNRFVNIPGIGMGAATLIAHGTEEQKSMLRRMFTAEEIWCQLFSEPGAGSDLAGLSTIAVQEGDIWIVNGQKVWTSLAHHARWGLLLARTDVSSPKHVGLTYFLLDMDLQGIDVRPLYQITGEAEFSEVFLENVKVSDLMRVGNVGDGWSVARTTLMNERVAIGGQVPPREAGAIGGALKVWRERGLDDPALQDDLVNFWMQAEALRLTSIRAVEARREISPGPEGSIVKLRWAELNKSISAFTMDLLESAGMTYPGGYVLERPSEQRTWMENPNKEYLRSLADSIAGGTSEIMRNILGEQLLRLPPEPRTDKGVPWCDVPRN